MFFQLCKKLKSYGFTRGMTYAELIVVLTIFSMMSGIVMFNYGKFQAKVDIKNLANDITLKFVEAQKAAVYGRLPASLSQQSQIGPNWKPAYGIFMDISSDNKSFVYFTDLNSNNFYEGPDCTGECIEKITVTKGNYVSRVDVFYQDSSNQSLNNLTLSFVRPDSTATIRSSVPINPNVSYVQITIVSPQEISSTIKVYASGRVQIN